MTKKTSVPVSNINDFYPQSPKFSTVLAKNKGSYRRIGDFCQKNCCY